MTGYLGDWLLCSKFLPYNSSVNLLISAIVSFPNRGGDESSTDLNASKAMSSSASLYFHE
ncbi:hypothetical protein RvY_06787 [Ramazzottius varieornatus]|uniref:Uncharacterized protein n=1 Tax=Ramazzottius varieornatus TaxID=947166 RepID=A0A1D1V537_RAMVA|nr:hypothetical protein RvY_06787 [Ramazzottius varieornatus]